MARVVLTSFGSYGDVNPMLGLALVMRARGHHPVLAVPSSYREAVEREGLEHRSIRPEVDLDDRTLTARLMDPHRGTDTLFREILIPSLEASWSDIHAAAADADLLVTHPATLAGPMVAEEMGLPWASTVLAPVSFFSVHDPMVPAPAPWIHSLTSRSLVLSQLFRRLTERVTRRWAAPVRRLRRSRGLPPGDNPIMDGQHSPHLVLGLFSRVLGAPQPDWPDRVVVTGPILYNGPGPDTLAEPLRRFLDAGDPPLVFTLGSSVVRAAGSFYDVSAAAARRLDRRAVLLAGSYPDNRPRLGGDDIMVLDFARHAALFPRAAAIIHQGGAGTLHQALRAGRPMVVVPYSHDQPDNARRAERLGVARTLYPSRYRADRLESTLRTLLEEPAYQERALDVAAVVRAETGAEGAAMALESILDPSR